MFGLAMALLTAFPKNALMFAKKKKKEDEKKSNLLILIVCLF